MAKNIRSAVISWIIIFFCNICLSAADVTVKNDILNEQLLMNLVLLKQMQKVLRHKRCNNLLRKYNNNLFLVIAKYINVMLNLQVYIHAEKYKIT